MTDYEHAEVSRDLALAIGWKPEQLFDEHDGSYCAINISQTRYVESWREFDYRDTAVIWAIAERFNCFPRQGNFKGAWFSAPGPEHSFGEWAGSASLAVARAVIAMKQDQHGETE